MKFAPVIQEGADSQRRIQEHRQAVRASSTHLIAEQGVAGKFIGGEPFEAEAMGPVAVRQTGSDAASVTEAPSASGDETLSGYALVEMAGRDEAVALAKT